MNALHALTPFILDYEHSFIGHSLLLHADCFQWMKQITPETVHAIVTDPPYGVKEYEPAQLEKRTNGNGGIWRIPPSFDGHTRAPLPRFTALNQAERENIQLFFYEWATLALGIMRPGGHLLLASNTYLSQLVFTAVADAGFEYRGQVIRLVRTLRGGDKPKNAEAEFPDVCTMPRGCYEPWGIFRKPLPQEMTIADCLRAYQTGGLRRKPDGKPFADVIESERTPQRERGIADHPSLKPQSFLRQIVYAALPLGQGIVLDPFMGSGSTVAASEAVGYPCIGVERLLNYYEMSINAVPRLAELPTTEQQLSLGLA